MIEESESIVFFGGAGVSTESGIPDFRSADGICLLYTSINAEIPERNFMPSAGRITDLHLPGGNGIRVDTAVYSGCEVLPLSLIHILSVWQQSMY